MISLLIIILCLLISLTPLLGISDDPIHHDHIEETKEVPTDFNIENMPSSYTGGAIGSQFAYFDSEKIT